MAEMEDRSGNKAVKKSGIFIVKLNWPDLLALTGIMFALISVLHSHYGRLENAIAFMFVGMFIDLLGDVFVRTFKMERLFGRFLDGFIEFMVYLIAPAVFFYYFGFERLHIVWILLLYGACGVIRLSVYDQTGDVKLKNDGLAYLGMPVFWSHFIAAAFYGLPLIMQADTVVYLAGIVMFAYGFLMIMNIRFVQFEKKPYMFVIVIAMMALFLYLGLSKGQTLFG
jgi:CDP-diacylglycerol--serine O-phosphatidyltransferase